MKQILTFITIGVVVLGLVATASAATTIRLWGHSNPAWVKANEEIIKNFEAEYPDINVVYETFPYDGLIAKLQTSFLSGRVADIVEIWGMWAPQYIQSNHLAEVPKLVYTPSQMENEFFGPTVAALSSKGRYYGVPREYNLEYGGIYVNKDLFAEAGVGSYPATWSELVTAAKKLTQYSAGSQMTQAGFHFINGDSFQFLFDALILQQGGSIWAEDGVHVDFTTPEAEEALQFLAEFGLKHKVVSVNMPPAHEAFLQGRTAMYHRGPWVAGVLDAEYPNINYDYIPVPRYNDSDPYFYAETGWSLVVSEPSPHQEAAWKFVEYMTNPESSRVWNNITGTIPARKDIAEDSEFRASRRVFAPSFAALPFGQFIGDVKNRDRMWDIQMERFVAVLYGRTSVKQAIVDMENQINSMIDEYQ